MQSPSVQIRLQRPGDEPAIRSVNEASFARSAEADLVEQLQRDHDVLVSCVAVSGEQIVGHILFSRVLLHGATASIPSVALAPMAVLPSYQRRGVGSELVRFGLETLRVLGERSVLVLGHPHFYSRFGFSSASARRLVTPFPPDAFMALTLVSDAINEVDGAVTFPPAFGL
jgi:putative acetyltransferase